MSVPSPNKQSQKELPDWPCDALEPIKMAVQSVAATAFGLIALQKLEVWYQGKTWFADLPKILTSGKLEAINSIKTGGMIGVASLIDSLFGLIIYKAYTDGWLPDALGIQTKHPITNWDKEQPIAETKPEQTKPEIQLPHWLRIAQRAAALAITCFIFTTLFGAQPLLLACAAADITWFVISAVRAGHDAPCEHSGAVMFSGQALRCASREVYLGCAILLGTAYLAYKVFENKNHSSKYYLSKDGKRVGKPIILSHVQAKNHVIGLRKLNTKEKMHLEMPIVSDLTLKEKTPSKKNLQELLEKYQDQLNNIDQSKLFTHSTTLKNDLEKAHLELLAFSLKAEFYHEFNLSNTKENLLKELETRIQELEESQANFNKLSLESFEALAKTKASNDTFQERKNNFISAKKENLRASTLLPCLQKLRSDLNSKKIDEIQQDFADQRQAYQTIYERFQNWKMAKGAFEHDPFAKSKRKDAITANLRSLIAITEYKLAQNVPEASKTPTVYWRALRDGQPVIIPEDQIRYLPAEDAKTELNRQETANRYWVKVSKDVVNTGVNAFLQGMTGLDMTKFIGGGGLSSHLWLSAASGATEILKFCDDNGPFGTLKQAGKFLNQDMEQKEPTGNGNENQTPNENAVESAQAIRCAQLIDHYKPYYDMKKNPFRLKEGDEIKGNAWSAERIFNNDKEGKPIPGDLAIDVFPKHPDGHTPPREQVIGIVNRALIDELGIKGTPQTEKQVEEIEKLAIEGKLSGAALDERRAQIKAQKEQEQLAKLDRIIAMAQGETMAQRAARKEAKREALKKAKTEEEKEAIRKQYAKPQASFQTMLSDAKLNHMELITPTPGKDFMHVKEPKRAPKEKAYNPKIAAHRENLATQYKLSQEVKDKKAAEG